MAVAQRASAEDMLLTTRVIESAGHTVIVVDGEVDLATAGQFRQSVLSSIDANDRPLILDLAGLRFCDSAGLAIFVAAHNALSSAGRRFVLARPSNAVLRVLELSGLTQVITTTTDLGDADSTESRPDRTTA